MDFCRIAPDVKLGQNVLLHAFVNLYGCVIGDNTKIGTFVEIQKGVSIGRNCKISSHSFICEGVKIKNNVFVGHNVTFINDKFPLSINADGSMKNDNDWNVITTIIENDVSIGSGTTILCGVNIGKGALIGAGAVVTKDIPSNEIWAGNPARFLRKVSK
ncbi:MAG: N-acetyltransferase [Desulfobacteraceae bacterium]|nr:N-acetyltransferase [Desulfobacteraceae bacterium]MBC2756748.1 N-acetyltransferase [Desulfobacteraceae bacterium]